MAYPLALGAITFFLAVIWGRPLINWLIRNEMGKKIRVEDRRASTQDGHTHHGWADGHYPCFGDHRRLNIANLLGFNFIGQSVLIPLSTLVAFGLLGLIDDLEGIRGKRAKGEGIMARTKASWQVIFALIIALILYFGPTDSQRSDPGHYRSHRDWPSVGTRCSAHHRLHVERRQPHGWVGWASRLLAAVAFACFGVIAYLQGQVWLAAFCFTMVGSLLAFLWFNAHPAELFMGDVGSLAIGATLAVVALMTGQWLLLPIVGPCSSPRPAR